MGIVYDACDPNIGRCIALKTILWRDLGDQNEREWLRERLFREARSAGSLNHPGIIIIYEAGEDSEHAFIAMERVEGPTLETILRSGRVSDRATLLNILEQIAEALDFAHENGIVHRDVKPGNIMLHRNSLVKIADFGIAKVLGTQHHTKTGMLMGTPSYMSPEQIKSQSLDGRADQFSLGVIAYEMLTGQKPFGGDTLATVVHQIVYGEPRSLREIRPEMMGGVEAVLQKALSKAPTERYPTCAQFVQALRRALDTVTATNIAAGVSKPKVLANSTYLALIAAVVVTAGAAFETGYVVGHNREATKRAALEQQAPAEHPSTPNASEIQRWLNKASGLVEQGNYQDAISEYDAILIASPGNTRAIDGRAKALRAKNTEEQVLK